MTVLAFIRCVLLMVLGIASAVASQPIKSAAAVQADEVVARYMRTVAPHDATERVTTRIMKGQVRAEWLRRRQVDEARVEIYERPPDRWTRVWLPTVAGRERDRPPTTPHGDREGFDGKAGWMATSSAGLRAWTPAEVAEKLRDADVSKGARLRQLYAGFRLARRERLGEREVDVVEALRPEGGPAEILYFDRETAYLVKREAVRKVWAIDDLFEDVLFTFRYEDYREVDGLRLPFHVVLEAPLFGYDIRFTEIRHNVPIDDARFTAPTRP